MNLKLSRYIIFTAAINPDDRFDMQNRIIYSTVTNISVVVKRPVFDQLTDGKFDGLDPDLVRQLLRANILVPDDRDEFSAVLAENRVFNRNLSIAFNPAANCRAGCTCSAQRQVEKKMDDSVWQRLLDYAEQQLGSGQFTSFNMVWDGMEPSVVLPGIIHLSEKYLELSDGYDIPYKASMVTDGAGLTKEVFETLFYRCGIKNFHITWTPGFETVFHTIERILREVPFKPRDGVIFEIRINIDKTNQEAPFGLIDRFADHCFQNRVTFRFDQAINVAATGPDDIAPGDTGGFDTKEFAELEFEFLLHAIQKGFIQSILPARTFVPCFAVDESSVVADQYGNLFSCHALPYMNHPASEPNRIGDLLSAGNDLRANTRFRNWFNQLENDKGICYGCSLFPSCGGGCRLKDGEEESACPPFKYNIEDRLILNYIHQKSGFNNLMASPF